MTEQELVDGIKTRNETAFRELVSLYQKGIMNTCLAIVHNTDDAEDITQEVFIELLRSADKFRGDARLSTWLYRVAVNKSLNLYSSKKRRNIFGFLSKDAEQEVVNSAEHEAGHKETRRILHSAVDALPKNQKIAFILNKYDELSYKEVAGIMNISVSSVESLLFRAKKNLQVKLKDHYTSGL